MEFGGGLSYRITGVLAELLKEHVKETKTAHCAVPIRLSEWGK